MDQREREHAAWQVRQWRTVAERHAARGNSDGQRYATRRAEEYALRLVKEEG
mgnify:CR=1 FL=1